MRPALALAAFLAPFAIAAIPASIVSACGGSAFTASAGDGGPAPAVLFDAGDAGGSFCALEAGTHTFCDDFDSVPLSTKWSSIDQSGNDSVVKWDPTTSDSPPNSLESVAGAAPLAESRGRVIESFTGTASKVVVAFVVRIDSASATPKLTGEGGNSIIGIDVGPNYSIGIEVHDTVGYFETLSSGDGGNVQTLSSGTLLASTTTLESGWTELVIEVDLALQTLSITIGGQQELNNKPITPQNGAVSVLLGAYLHDEATTLSAHFDNVTIDLTK